MSTPTSFRFNELIRSSSDDTTDLEHKFARRFTSNPIAEREEYKSMDDQIKDNNRRLKKKNYSSIPIHREVLDA